MSIAKILCGLESFAMVEQEFGGGGCLEDTYHDRDSFNDFFGPHFT